MFFEDRRPIVALPGVSLEPGSREKSEVCLYWHYKCPSNGEY